VRVLEKGGCSLVRFLVLNNKGKGFRKRNKRIEGDRELEGRGTKAVKKKGGRIYTHPPPNRLLYGKEEKR
jgi:hypothetical protein